MLPLVHYSPHIFTQLTKNTIKISSEEMQTLMLRSPFIPSHTSSPILNSLKPSHHLPISSSSFPPIPHTHTKSINTKTKQPSTLSKQNTTTKHVVLGAMSIGVMMFLMANDDHQKALALGGGPEGPLMEEFWDNVRRYGLYILTVSSGALYTIFQPIFELLKNPISAILVLIILGGGFYIVSQVVSAMIGATDFDYQYYY